MRRIRLLVVMALIPTTGFAEDGLAELRAEARARAEAAGVPFAPVERKIAEGAAKGVPAARVRPVIDALIGRLEQGSGACVGWSERARCVEAAADALQVGVPAAVLQQSLRGEAAERARLEVLYAVSDLRARGVPAAVGLALLDHARRGPGGVSDMVHAIVAEAGASGRALPDVARDAVRRGPPDREGNFGATRGRADPAGRAAQRGKERAAEAAGRTPGRPDGPPGHER